MPRVSGSSVHIVSAATLAILGLFVLAILVLILVDISNTTAGTTLEALATPELQHAIYLSLTTSFITLALVLLFGVPAGYALSRYRFPGSMILDAVVDLPIVLPPVVIGLSLLLFFRTAVGQWLESIPALRFVYTTKGIVLCQFFLSASYAIRSSKAAFDSVSVRTEQLALTLGCTRPQAFYLVALPMARAGIAAGAVMAWARAVGVFGPMMIFVGAVRMKTEVMPTTIYLELSVGRIEPALAVALLMIIIAVGALTAIHWLGQRHRWWGP